MGKGSKDLDPSLPNDDQEEGPLMTTTSSSPMPGHERGKRQYTWEEIRRHSKKTDRWLVIDKRVYDVTRWVKHPGGQVVLNHYAGQDATEAFQALHADRSLVQKYLKPLYIGDVISGDEEEKKNVHTTDDQVLKEDFEKLRQKAVAQKLFHTNSFFYILVCFQVFALEFAAYYVLLKFGTGWLPYLATFVLYVISQAQSGWIQHDFGHLSVFKSSSWNHIFHRIFIGSTKGGSADWWNNMHFQHHSKPNVIDKDPDTRIEPLFLLGDTLPIRQAQKNAKHGKQMPYNFQHLYFFIAAPLLFPLYFQFMTIRHAIKRRLWLDLAFLSLHYLRFYSIMPLKLGLLGALKLHFIIRAAEGTWFVLVTQSNHVVMDVSHDDSEMSWFRMQLKATCNIAKSPFNDWFTGHLNFQIEHHLFPMMPRHNLYKIQSDVMDLCKKHQIPYIIKPLGRAFYDILTSLEKSGRMWMETYDELRLTTSDVKSD